MPKATAERITHAPCSTLFRPRVNRKSAEGIATELADTIRLWFAADRLGVDAYSSGDKATHKKAGDALYSCPDRAEALERIIHKHPAKTLASAMAQLCAAHGRLDQEVLGDWRLTDAEEQTLTEIMQSIRSALYFLHTLDTPCAPSIGNDVLRHYVNPASRANPFRPAGEVVPFKRVEG